jgi:hypothetical protein
MSPIHAEPDSETDVQIDEGEDCRSVPHGHRRTQAAGTARVPHLAGAAVGGDVVPNPPDGATSTCLYQLTDH